MRIWTYFLRTPSLFRYLSEQHVLLSRGFFLFLNMKTLQNTPKPMLALSNKKLKYVTTTQSQILMKIYYLTLKQHNIILVFIIFVPILYYGQWESFQFLSRPMRLQKLHHHSWTMHTNRDRKVIHINYYKRTEYSDWN